MSRASDNTYICNECGTYFYVNLGAGNNVSRETCYKCIEQRKENDNLGRCMYYLGCENATNTDYCSKDHETLDRIPL